MEFWSLFYPIPEIIPFYLKPITENEFVREAFSFLTVLRTGVYPLLYLPGWRPQWRSKLCPVAP